MIDDYAGQEQGNSGSEKLRVIVTHCDMVAAAGCSSDEDGLMAFVQGLEYDWKEVNEN